MLLREKEPSLLGATAGLKPLPWPVLGGLWCSITSQAQAWTLHTARSKDPKIVN